MRTTRKGRVLRDSGLWVPARPAIIRPRARNLIPGFCIPHVVPAAGGVAFSGALLDTGTVTATSITNPLSVVAGGGLSVAVSVGDLVIAVLGQQGNLTVTAVTDNLGNTYVASNAGSAAAGDTTGRMFYSRVTNAGTLNSVNFATTASSNNAAAAVAVFAGPFIVSPVDANPANTVATGTAGTPINAPATGTLTQTQELVVSWICVGDDLGYDGSSTGTFAVRANVANIATTICRSVTAATTTITHVFTASGGLSSQYAVIGTTSFKAA